MLHRIRFEQPLDLEGTPSLLGAVEQAIEEYGDQAVPLGPDIHDLTPHNSNYTIHDRVSLKVFEDGSAVSGIALHEGSGEAIGRNVMRIPQDCDSLVVLSLYRRNIHRKAGRLSLFNTVYEPGKKLEHPLQQVVFGNEATVADLRQLPPVR